MPTGPIGRVGLPFLPNAPEAEMLPGPASVMWTRYDLADLGYTAEEFMVSGTANAYSLSNPTDPGSVLRGESSATYRTRVAVFRPTDLARWSGTVLTEWLNCRQGADTPPQWIRMHRHIARRGMIWVGVSAQRVGIEGEEGDDRARHLKAMEPERYHALSHPGDAYAFDIFAQVALLICAGELSFRKPTCLLATGSSQSARFLTTYLNAIDPGVGAFDGFLLTGRHRSGAALDGRSICGDRVPLRGDVRVPVFVLQAETDPFGRMRSFDVRQEDTGRFRLWEVASSAHGDSYMAKVGRIDDGLHTIDELADTYLVDPGDWLPLKLPMNASPAFHYVHHAALDHLEAWAKTGATPPVAPCLLGSPSSGLERDDHGIACGGVRTPWADCAAWVFSGENDEAGEFEGLFGQTLAPSADRLAELYPRGEADYIREFEAALQRSITSGFILNDDAAEVRELALALYRRLPITLGGSASG